MIFTRVATPSLAPSRSRRRERRCGLPSIRTIASRGSPCARSWERMPRWESQASRPTQRPVTRSFDPVSSPRRSWQRPSARPDSVTTLRRWSEESVLIGPLPGSSRGRAAGGRRQRRGRVDVASCLQVDGRVDLLDLAPVDADFAAAADPAGEAADPAGALGPSSRARRGSRRPPAPRPAPPSIARSSTLPQRRPSLSSSWWSRTCRPMSNSLRLNSGPRS